VSGSDASTAREDPLLVVIDMQRVFAEGPWGTPGFAGIVEPIRSLVESFGDRTCLTRFLVPERPEGAWVEYYRDWEFVTRPEAAPLLDLVEPFASNTRAAHVDLPTFSKWGPEMAALAGPSRTLVVCGVATDCCVISTVLGAIDGGMHVRLVADACRGLDDAAHDRAVEVMGGYLPQVRITSVRQELADRRITASG
jgi:nicotinamidase-related amidase